MYQVWIPIYNRKHTEKEKEILAGELKRSGADMAMITFERVLRSEKMLSEEKEFFLEIKDYLEARGIKVGAWLCPTVGYGGTGVKGRCDNDADRVYTRMKHFSGKLLYSYCPLDEAFTDDFCRTLEAICSTGVDTILFEDDFTLSGGKSYDLGCACPLHLKMYSERAGREISEAEMKKALYEGGDNPLRQVWKQCVGETLINFARKIDRWIHEKYPEVKIGLSANASSCATEGVTIFDLARAVAGKHRPFVRITGAPYWKNAPSCGTNMEAIRLQAHWSGGDVDCITEGDTYPRPRAWVPANLLESYDMITRAAGGTSGILKYMIDYTAAADFEPGYIDRHLKNQKHYEKIGEFFDGKQSVGLNIFENSLIFNKTEFDETITVNTLSRNYPLPTVSQELCVEASLPTAYGSKVGASVIFGENAHFADDALLNRGVILDGTAARILQAKGVDVGIRDCKRAAENPLAEYFRIDEQYVSASLDAPGIFYDFALREGAQVLSDFVTGEGALAAVGGDMSELPRYPACYRYENARGQRFLVYSFAAHTARVKKGWARGLFRNYLRQNQLISAVEWLQKRPLPAVCPGNPGLYILCKRDKDRLAVGLWNLFLDEVPAPEILLDGEYSALRLYNGEGSLCGNKVKLQNDIPPFGFVWLDVRALP